jgi:pyrroline-5-carboxylate reductase
LRVAALFDFITKVFGSSGSTITIDENEMNRIISVTGSSPAYVFKFIAAICEGAKAQGIESDAMLNTVCDMVIGAATMLKVSELSAAELISRVASKGGTTERALLTLDSNNFDNIIIDAMKACTTRADELGAAK